RRGWLQNLVNGPQGPGQTDENFGSVRGGPAPDDAHLTGVLLRLNPDGSIPNDNPFVDIRTTLQAPRLSGAVASATGAVTAFLNQAMGTRSPYTPPSRACPARPSRDRSASTTPTGRSFSPSPISRRGVPPASSTPR